MKNNKKQLRFILKKICFFRLILLDFPNVFFKKRPRELWTPGFSGFFDFAVCVRVFCTFPYDWGPFSVIFLHFLQKYRCVPKIGFSADIFLSFSFIFFRSIVVYLKLGSRLTYFWSFSFIFFRSIVVYLKSGSRLTILLTFLLTFLSTFLLTFVLTFVWTFSLAFY